MANQNREKCEKHEEQGTNQSLTEARISESAEKKTDENDK